jgi:hypothetical protein
LIFLLIQAALADSCCSTGGAQPTLLSSCDALGVAFGVGGELETGGWSWQGSWSGVGDDGGGTARFTVAMMGRFAPWLQGGLQVPVELSVDRLDGEATASAGVGSGLVWLSLDTPPGWPSATTPHLGLDLGLGSQGLHGRPRLQLGLRLSAERGPWTAWGALTARFPLLPEERPDGDLAVVVDRRFLPTLRAGLGLGLLGAAGPAPSYALSLGPTLVFSPTHADRLLFSLRAGLPLPHLGQNELSQVTLNLDWFRVLAHRG